MRVWLENACLPVILAFVLLNNTIHAGNVIYRAVRYGREPEDWSGVQ